MAVRLYRVRGLRWKSPKVKKAFRRATNRWLRHQWKQRGVEAPKKVRFVGYAD